MMPRNNKDLVGREKKVTTCSAVADTATGTIWIEDLGGLVLVSHGNNLGTRDAFDRDEADAVLARMGFERGEDPGHAGLVGHNPLPPERFEWEPSSHGPLSVKDRPGADWGALVHAVDFNDYPEISDPRYTWDGVDDGWPKRYTFADAG